MTEPVDGRPPVGRAKITAVGVERNFATKHAVVAALGPFDLTVAEGEFVCLVGPSGCGKSTFLRLVAGLLRPTTGYVDIVPRDQQHTPVAMVFQDYSIFPWKSVEKNVQLGLDLAGVPKKEARDRARHWIDRLGLSGFEQAHPNQLSGGMRQRVSIARALAVEPEILLMDEPFAALDAQLRLLLQEELLALWQADRRTVLFVTHSLEEAVLLGDRVVVMSSRPGRTVGDYVVPFERPRSGALRGTPEFAALQSEIWGQLREQVQASIVKPDDATAKAGR